jgi:cytochrome c-type biogenesis protein CcmH/NrfG
MHIWEVNPRAVRPKNCNMGSPMILCSQKDTPWLEGQGCVKIQILKIPVICLTLGLAMLVCFLLLRLPHEGSHPAAQSIPALRPSHSGTSLQDPSKVQNAMHEEKVLNLALQKKPGHAPVLLQLAQLEAAKGQFKEAEGHLQQIVNAEPANIAARLELGKTKFQLGDVAGALENTLAILKSNPTQPDALYNLGAIYGNLGDKKRALEYWNKLLSTAPNSESGKHARQLISQLQMSTR